MEIPRSWPKWVLDLAFRQKKFSSTFVEVFNCISAICTFAGPGSRVHLFTDSQAGFYALTKRYSSCKHICQMIHALCDYCTQNKIMIVRISWIRRKFNQRADDLSHGNVQVFLNKVGQVGYRRAQPIVLQPLVL